MLTCTSVLTQHFIGCLNRRWVITPYTYAIIVLTDYICNIHTAYYYKAKQFITCSMPLPGWVWKEVECYIDETKTSNLEKTSN